MGCSASICLELFVSSRGAVKLMASLSRFLDCDLDSAQRLHRSETESDLVKPSSVLVDDRDPASSPYECPACSTSVPGYTMCGLSSF